MKRSGLVMDFGLLGIGKKCTFEVTYIEPHTLFSFCHQVFGEFIWHLNALYTLYIVRTLPNNPLRIIA